MNAKMKLLLKYWNKQKIHFVNTAQFLFIILSTFSKKSYNKPTRREKSFFYAFFLSTFHSHSKPLKS